MYGILLDVIGVAVAGMITFVRILLATKSFVASGIAAVTMSPYFAGVPVGEVPSKIQSAKVGSYLGHARNT
jgi:hypothetical protein